MQENTSRSVRIASDVGGTFTDIVTFNERSGELLYGKTLTTPGNLVEGIVNGVHKAGVGRDQTRLFLHGTTIAINTVLERTGARTALLTTRGFRDVYEIGRINRPQAYNLFFRKHRPLIPRSWRFEVNERITAAGAVLEPLDEAQIAQIAAQLRAEQIGAVAILFFHSYRNPAHEQRARELIEQLCPGVYVCASHELSQEYREYERTSTVAANAYIGPRIHAYLGEIEARLKTERLDGPFFVVQSNGGLFDAGRAQRECIRMLESGPAAGVVGARAVCERIGLRDAIAFDMGGTTAKAGVVHDGQPMMAGNIMVGGYEEGLPIQIPLIDIQEVGTGGGSIAYIEPGGGLRVGPRSAGAAPGPVCYGLGGTEPTITDANLVLGRLSAENFLGGEMKLDLAAARQALQDKVADPLQLPLTAAANGMIRIACTTMSQVVTRVTTERGLDAGDFAMIAYGGAGPLHACLVARELNIPTVIIPRSPGHFSAYGMLMADLRRDFVHTWFRPVATLDFAEMERLYAVMEEGGRQDVLPHVADAGSIVTARSADMRYVGQEHPVTVELPAALFDGRDRAALKQHFDAEHMKRYGFNSVKDPAEIVSLYSSVVGVLDKPRSKPVAAAPAGRVPVPGSTREVFFAEGAAQGFLATPVFQRDALLAGDRIAGPALVEEHASTTVVPPGDRALIGEHGDIIITIARMPGQGAGA